MLRAGPGRASAMALGALGQNGTCRHRDRGGWAAPYHASPSRGWQRETLAGHRARGHRGQWARCPHIGQVEAALVTSISLPSAASLICSVEKINLWRQRRLHLGKEQASAPPAWPCSLGTNGQWGDRGGGAGPRDLDSSSPRVVSSTAAGLPLLYPAHLSFPICHSHRLGLCPAQGR